MFVIRQNQLIATTLLDLVIPLHVNKSSLVVISNQNKFAGFSLKEFKK